MPVTIGGVTYQWRTETVEDPMAGSLSFSHRGASTEDTHTEVIAGDDGSIVRFERPNDSTQTRRWWLPYPSVTAEVVIRAVAFATPGTQVTLYGDQVQRVVWGDAATWTVEQGLTAAAHALLEPDVAQLTMALLAVGCTATPDAQPAIDDWIASHADTLRDARPRLQQMLDDVRALVRTYPARSAIAFLLDWCARLNLDLGLDTQAVDARLEGGPKTPDQPTGVPWSHWWWRQHRTTNRSRDIHDDDD